MLDKEKIAENFSRSAPNYDQHAVLQKKLADEIFSRLTAYSLQLSTILDIGCGTGYLTAKLADLFPQAQITGIDIAPGMIEVARQNNCRKNIRYEVMDAEKLTFRKASFDLIVSNASLQWMDTRFVFYSVAKLLRSGGLFLFKTFGPKTLQELRQSGFRVNNFPTVEELQRDAKNIFSRADFASKTVKLKFDNAKELINHLKELGAQATDKNKEVGRETIKLLRSGENTTASFEVISGLFVL